MNYWVKRNLSAQEKLTFKNERVIRKQLARYYEKSLNTLIGQFEKTYEKVKLNSSEGREITPADLYKLDAYWQLQAQLRQELQSMGEKQAAAISKVFELHFFDVYYSIAIPGAEEFSTIDKSAALQMINQIWCADGKSWSQRIWDNTNKLQQALNDNLISSVIAGKKTTELKQLLQDEFNVSYNRADTLVRTELAHIQTQAAQQRYKDYGIKEVEVWASKDERRCPVCGDLHQKRYPIGGSMPIPAHPRCRCTVIPVVE